MKTTVEVPWPCAINAVFFFVSKFKMIGMLMNVVYGLVQKSEQKHITKKSVRLHKHSLSIRRFWGKGERWKRKRERAEGEKRLTQMFLLEPSTPTQHDSIPSNQNNFRSLSCQLHVLKSSPKINLTLRSYRAPVLVLLRFRFFLKPPMMSFWILVM